MPILKKSSFLESLLHKHLVDICFNAMYISCMKKNVPTVVQETKVCSQEDADKVAMLLGELIEAVRIDTAIQEKQLRVKQMTAFRDQLNALSESVSKAIYKVEGDQYAMLRAKPSLKDSIARMHDFLKEQASR